MVCIISFMLAVFSIQVVQLSIFAAEGDKQPDFAKLFMRSERDYPPDGTHGPTPRALWVEAYKAHKAAGRIPSIPPAKKSENGLISYGPGIDGKSPEICSWTLDCRSPSDISNAPENMFGVSFDDGPADGTEVLMQFLTSQKQKATHFTIGVSIKKDTNAFMSMVNADHDIGCHTWSHQYLTTMTDEQVLGELGWQLQIVYDLTQEVQLYLRPPFGDCDNRIRAIAKHVFGMEVVMWKSDTKDWCLNPGSESASVCQVADAPKNEDELAKSLIKLAKASKNPGLITLEHETSSKTVNGFIKAYQEFKNNGWDMRSIAGLFSNHTNDRTHTMNTTSGDGKSLASFSSSNQNYTVGSSGGITGPPVGRNSTATNSSTNVTKQKSSKPDTDTSAALCLGYNKLLLISLALISSLMISEIFLFYK